MREMLQALGWYFTKDRFTNIVKELDGAVHEYAEAKAAGKDEEYLRPLREAAREKFEDHCVRSGLRDEKAPYVNIDAEFFDGNSLDQAALDTFIKEILKGHGYQRILWTYMGTTGSFTVISKAEMAKNGQKYEDYLPIAYKKNHPVKKPFEGKFGKNEVLIYRYGDGTVSENYYPEKARLEFNRVKDKSGIDWKKGYDPNDEIKKDGWHGEFNEEGVWVRVEDKKESAAEETTVPVRRIELIKDGDEAILYDPGNTLISPAEIAYVTEKGEPYGSLELDTDKTLETIDRQLAELGVTHIGAIGTTGGENVLEQYKTLLGKKASPTLHLLDQKTLNTIKENKRKEAEAREQEKAGVTLERKITMASEYGVTGTGLENALGSGSVTVPLSPLKREDAAILGLTEKEQKAINDYAPKDTVRYGAIVSNLLASWDTYAASGKTKTEIAKLAADTLNGKESEDLRTTVRLGTIINGPEEPKTTKDVQFARSGIPGVFTETEPVDFFNHNERTTYLQRLEKKRIIPKGGAEAAETALGKSIPGVSKENQVTANKGLTRALSQYKEIAASTGMPLGEVIGAVVATTNGEAVPALQKQVYYELPVEKLCKEAGKQNNQKREVPFEDKAASVEVVIGGVVGVGLNEVGFTKKSLQETYGYEEQDAGEAEEFLKGIRAASPAVATGILPELSGIVKSQAGNGAKGLKAGVLSVLDRYPGTGYNVGSEAGWSAYRESPRYSGVSRTAIAGLLARNRGASAPYTKAPDSAVIEPRYRSVPGTVPVVRSRPRGMPENIVPAALYKGRSTAVVPAMRAAEIKPVKTEATPPIPVVQAAPTEPTVPPVSAGMERREPRQDARNRELERLRKIEANYEKDKAALAREKAPALARSESRDIGHAEGSGEKDGLSEREISKMTLDFETEVIRSGKFRT